MIILVLGANGFVGRAVCGSLSGAHNVYGASKSIIEDDKNFRIDLTDKKSIVNVLNRVNPEAIINCAGVVENSEAAKLNLIFTRNLLEVIADTGIKVNRVIVSGSAAEYGRVEEKNIPVNEEVPLNPVSIYGQSKVDETELALKFQEEKNIPVTIVRIFNPIGSRMHPKFIIPGIIRQVDAILAGEKIAIEVTRLDSKRDYIDIQDIASALKFIVENQPQEKIYNIGSGLSTSNEELINLIVKNSELRTMPKIIETVSEEEPLLAIQADISRIKNEFGWKPVRIIEETIREAMNDSR